MVEPLSLVQNRHTMNQFEFQLIQYNHCKYLIALLARKSTSFFTSIIHSELQTTTLYVLAIELRRNEYHKLQGFIHIMFGAHLCPIIIIKFLQELSWVIGGRVCEHLLQILTELYLKAN